MEEDSLREYTKRTPTKFKSVSTPLAQHFKLEKMSKILYSSAIGSLMYLMVRTGPTLAHYSSLVSRYMSNPEKWHWKATKWVLRYLVGSINRSLLYKTT